MKKVLIITYSQSGQLDEIISNVINKLHKDTSINIHHEKLVPEPAFPFPWSDMSFWDAMPESVKLIPSEITNENSDPNDRSKFVFLPSL